MPRLTDEPWWDDLCSRADQAGRALVAELMREGWTQARIAKTLRVKRDYVTPIAAEIRDELAVFGWRPPLNLDARGCVAR
jgi:hypothetical protein